MNYTQFSAGLPPDRTMVFRSVEENEEAMRRMGVDQRIRQLGTGAFRCDMAVSETEEAVLFSDRFSKAFSMVLEAPEDSFGFLFLRSASGQALASGKNAANDWLVLVPKGSATDIVAPDLVGSEAMTLPQARIVELTEILCPFRKSALPEDMAAIAGDTEQLHALHKTLTYLVAHPESDPRGEAVANLVAATIAWMGDSSNQWRSEGFHGNGARRRIAKRTQEFIEEHYREPVHLTDLCRAAAVGVRTLQRCFREYFGLTISDYLKAVRFDEAQRALALADPARDSVTAIAMQQGHTHLGRFSVEYRKRYGESPRETLARQAGRKG